MKTQSRDERFKRRRSPGSTFINDIIDHHIEDCIILADMRERVRAFGSSPMRFV